MKKIVVTFLTLVAVLLLTGNRPVENVKAGNTPRPIASEYNAIRNRAKSIAARLHSQNPAEAALAQQQWAAMIRDLEGWANKYQVHLLSRNGTGASGTTISTHLPLPPCKDFSNLNVGTGVDSSSIGHCYLTKQVNPRIPNCQYLCVPPDVIQEPDIEDSPYPNSKK